MARRDDKTPLMAFLQVNEVYEREILFVLERGISRIDQELRSLEAKQGVGAMIRRDQLRQARSAIHRRITEVWKTIGSTVMAGRHEAAGVASDVMSDYTQVLLNAALDRDAVAALQRAAREQAVRGVAHVESRALGLSKIPLSQRVYRSAALVNGQVDRIIDSALARGASARELADDVRKYIKPSTPGGIKYAARRLGRTELNNAFHATQVYEAQANPWITTMVWRLSGSHTIPDECNEYASQSHYDGGSAGAFLPAEVPGKPHPQCLCYVTPTTVSTEEFVRKFNAGEYDKRLTQLGYARSV